MLTPPRASRRGLLPPTSRRLLRTIPIPGLCKSSILRPYHVICDSLDASFPSWCSITARLCSAIARSCSILVRVADHRRLAASRAFALRSSGVNNFALFSPRCLPRQASTRFISSSVGFWISLIIFHVGCHLINSRILEHCQGFSDFIAAAVA